MKTMLKGGLLAAATLLAAPLAAAPAASAAPAPAAAPVVANYVDVLVEQYYPYHKAGTYLNGVKLTRNVPLTASERATLASLDDDNKLAYRENRVLWGTTTVKQVRVFDYEFKAHGYSFYATLKAKTGMSPWYNVASVPPGGAVTKAWVLQPGATFAQPWGPNRDLAPVDYDRASLPLAFLYS